MKCPYCKKEIGNLKTIKIKELKIEVETEIHDKNKCLKDIEIPKGLRLLTMNEITWLHNSKYKEQLNLNDTWEFIEQPFKQNKDKGDVARFYAGSDWANLNCGTNPSNSYGALGVRFCRSLK